MASFHLCTTHNHSHPVAIPHFSSSHLSSSHANASSACKALPKNLGSQSYWPLSNFRLTATVCTQSSALGKQRRGKVGKLFVGMGDSFILKEKGDIRVFENGDDLAGSLAEYIDGISKSAIKERGAFSVLLSGGSLINALRKLTEPPYLNSIDWGRWHVLWADERVVPRDHPDSNYKLAYENFLSKVPIVPGHVYSISDSLSAEAAAEDYETGLRQLVKTEIVGVSKCGDFPKFDLILLGMGPDGHVASLFPGHPLLNEKKRWITFITDSPKPPPERITVTLPVINLASNIVVFATGAGKAETLKRVLGDGQHDELLPVQIVSPIDGKLTWFTDKEAAANILS